MRLKNIYIAIAFICISLQMNAINFDTLRVFQLDRPAYLAIIKGLEKLREKDDMGEISPRITLNDLNKSMTVIPSINIYATDTIDITLNYTQGDMPSRMNRGHQNTRVYLYFNDDTIKSGMLYDYVTDVKRLHQHAYMEGNEKKHDYMKKVLKDIVNNKASKGLIFNVRLFAYPTFVRPIQKYNGHLTIVAYLQKASKQIIFVDMFDGQEYVGLDEFLVAKFESVENYAKLAYWNEHYHNSRQLDLIRGIYIHKKDQLH